MGIKYGYYPEDALRAQECDMIVDSYGDILKLLFEASQGKGLDPSTKVECQEKFWPELDKFLAFIEPFCGRAQFLTGQSICVADFWVGSLILSTFKNPEVNFGKDSGSWNKRLKMFPAFRGYVDRICIANQVRLKTRPPK